MERPYKATALISNTLHRQIASDMPDNAKYRRNAAVARANSRSICEELKGPLA